MRASIYFVVRGCLLLGSGRLALASGRVSAPGAPASVGVEDLPVARESERSSQTTELQEAQCKPLSATGSKSKERFTLADFNVNSRGYKSTVIKHLAHGRASKIESRADLLDRYVRRSLPGERVNGNAGERFRQSDNERKQLVTAAAEVLTQRVPTVMGMSADPAAEVSDLVRSAKRMAMIFL